MLIHFIHVQQCDYIYQNKFFNVHSTYFVCSTLRVILQGFVDPIMQHFYSIRYMQILKLQYLKNIHLPSLMHQADYRLLFEGSTLVLEREIKSTGIFPSLRRNVSGYQDFININFK